MYMNKNHRLNLMEKVVCVTGATGYVASWLVKLLLLRGYTVHATVRNLSDSSKIGPLLSLDGANERLHLFNANLMEQGSFDAAVHGCQGVFHVASPVILENVTDPQVELIEPAVKGTLNVLKSCTKAPSVKRVVLTSSMATVMLKRNFPTDCADETWFSDLDFCQEIKHWYVLSKVLAEEAAIKFAQEHGIDLVVMNPAFVVGPLLQPNLNLTCKELLQFLLQGENAGMPNDVCVLVDVRDVGNAHILAFENPSASGRYCLTSTTLSSSEFFNILLGIYPTFKVPKRIAENPQASAPFRVSKQKVKDSLGMDYIPIEQSLKDTVESFKEMNLINITI